jgi:TrpR family trp operon transcriptional repressor
MNKTKQYTTELAGVMAEIRDKQLMSEFLQDILTPNELQEVVTRWQIVKRLAKHVPQRKIAEELEVGIATVTRGSRELLDPRGGFNKVLEKFS